MKSKIYIIGLFLLNATTFSFGQSATAKIKGSIVQTTPDAVMIKLKSNETFSGQMTNLQFTIQIPNTISPQPTVTIKSNPNSAYVPSANYFTEVSNEGGFYNYLFGATTVGSPAFNFIANAEVNIMEMKFSGAIATTSVRLAQLPNGGGTGQKNFYIEIGGDNTDQAAMFYGAGATNNAAGYTAYSYVPFAGIVLPVKITSFTATKKDNDALLTWVVENETAAVSNYEIERSIDGIKFDKIITIAKNTNASNIYNITDANLLAIKNNGIIYYRVKQMDVNGGFTYSEIRNVRTSEKGGLISAYPNPAKDFTTLRIDAETAGEISLALVNADGKQLYNSTMQAQKGINLQRINMSTFASGNYLLKATINGEIKTIAIVKL